MVVDETWNRMLQYNGVQSRRRPKKEIRNEVIGKKGKMLRKVPDWSGLKYSWRYAISFRFVDAKDIINYFIEALGHFHRVSHYTARHYWFALWYRNETQNYLRYGHLTQCWHESRNCAA